MIITLSTGRSLDTERDLTAAERHILQKLMIWESMAGSLEEFREQRAKALKAGWNNSGPVPESDALRMVVEDLEGKVLARLGANRGQKP
jgi:hypothetical protein